MESERRCGAGDPNVAPHAINASGAITAIRHGNRILIRGCAVDTLTAPVPAIRIMLGVTGNNVVISDASSSTYQWAS